MNDASEKQEDLRARLFSLTSSSELSDFAGQLDRHDPINAAFAFLIDSWTALAREQNEKMIEPRKLLSEDLSAAMLGRFPVIFMGSNAWATKPYLPAEVHTDRVERLFHHLKETVRHFGNKRVILAVVPEKDYIVDRYFLETGRFAGIEAAMEHLAQRCAGIGIPFIHSQHLAPLRSYEKPEDFTYFDSHLSWRHYHQMFAAIMGALGTDWAGIGDRYTIKSTKVFGDLRTKFEGHPPAASDTLTLFRDQEAMSVVEGSDSFATPLGDTWQLITNENPLRSGKVLVLGDSHSSILSMHNLTYLLAGSFEKCQFHWNPMAIREPPPETDAEAVVMEISQRFML